MKKLLAFILLVCITCSLNGCVYSHNYDKDGNEISESEAKEIINTIIDEISDELICIYHLKV